ASSTRGSFTRIASTKSAGPSCPGSPAIRSAPIQPSWPSRSRLINNGLPANADRAEYGDPPYPVGLRGKTCHSRCLAAARKSTNAYAAGPKSPTPPYDGNDVTCSRTPDNRSDFIVSPLIASPVLPATFDADSSSVENDEGLSLYRP